MSAESSKLVLPDEMRRERKALFGKSRAELTALMAAMGEPGFRGGQLTEALYRQRVTEIGGITTLPRRLRERLAAEGWEVGRPRIVEVFRSVDGTERYLVEGVAGADTVETVWMPEGDAGEAGDGSEAGQSAAGAKAQSFSGEADVRAEARALRAGSGEIAAGAKQAAEKRLRTGKARKGTTSVAPQAPDNEDPGFSPRSLCAPESAAGKQLAGTWDRATICVSSQVGCAVNCQFCLTAKLGLQRNLTAGEIAGQVAVVLDRQGAEVGRDRVNLVFMGMGEPFLNYDSFMGAVRLLVEEVGLSPQRMTVSTSGIVPGIERFAREPAEVRPKLAISLNAPNDEVRSAVMPVNRKWPIKAVMDAVRGVKLRARERVTFEYVLLGGVTDRPEQAREVARLVRRTGLPAKVNLIAWNPGPGIAYEMPSARAVEDFRRALVEEGIATNLRRPRGRDIYAACGQLKRTVGR
ncbi:MAG TPA: 23S rRNA (adenine(2503)-C(2))-methyltransferase RlmN [Terracidiphilus sp.]|nr:23S rRNA (adenine(2503)-C(2))-methyltransferase RlmN [Terracidiphilus sp.]